MEVFLFLLAICPGILALPEQGAFEVTMTETQNIAVFTKSMYRNTSISTQISCNQAGDTEIRVSWMLRWTPCAQEYADIDSSRGIAQSYFENPSFVFRGMPYHYVKYIKSEDSGWKACHPHEYIELKQNFGPPIVQNATMPISQEIINKEMKKSAEDEKQVENKSGSRKKRDAEEGTKSAKPDPKTDAPKEDPADKKTQTPTNTVTTANPLMKSNTDFHKITETWEDGIYLFVLKIESRSDPQGQYQTFNTTVRVNMLGPRSGYLSAIEWPLLPFYGVMCVVYVIFGLIWLVLSACNWRDLLRIQFWIGGVIFLGMLEKAVFFAEYESINSTGKSVHGAILFGELVSCMKRTLARMLVIVVSLGFGIVKPRLGPMLHKVLAMGGLYFILCAVEGCLRDLKSKSDNSNQATLAAIPLAVLDAAICWWIFTGLVNTIRTLRLRRNLVKLSLYRHFTNTLIFAVVASVAFMVWSITQHKFSKCLSDWKELWVDEAFWHLLFSVILMVIMLLWRPSANNQRYAFSPLMDAADDEAGEPMINDAFDGMKMRGAKGQNGSPSLKEKSKADEDLKWIDENIPTAVTDTGLPSLLDSDEEMMNTKYEMSKME